MNELVHYIIGDIHGCLKELQDVVSKIKNDILPDQKTVIVTSGDYVDRGPDSAGVIRFLMNEQSKNTDSLQWFCLEGNHEEMMFRCGDFETWRSFGVDLNLFRNSRGIDARKLIPEDVSNWISSLPTLYFHGKLAVIHGNLDFNRSLRHQEKMYVLWDRDYKNVLRPDGMSFVHGHTPRTNIDLHNDPATGQLVRCNIDTGCVFGGKLTAIKIENADTLPVVTKVIQSERCIKYSNDWNV